MKNLIFLKLGGSLITEKSQAHTVRQEALNNLVGEIAGIMQKDPNLHILLGHGSGSFGHFPATKYKTRRGVSTPAGWRGFAEVWHEARELNAIVMEALVKVGVPAIAFSPCSQVISNDGLIQRWDTMQIRTALVNGLIPVIYGDVVFDHSLGGTILSTEELFEFLSAQLNPEKILLAGIEPGVWKDFPARTQIISTIHLGNLREIDSFLSQSANPDVTGGMKSKVRSMMNLIENQVCNEVVIFSGLEVGNLSRAVMGVTIGTRLVRDERMLQ